MVKDHYYLMHADIINILTRNMSFTILFLAALSAISLAFYLERLFVVIRCHKRIRDDIDKISNKALGTSGSEKSGELANAVMPGLKFAKPDNIADILFHYNVHTDEAIEKIKISISKLGSVASLAPYIGLFGTVVGIMDAFAEIAKTGSSNFAYVSKGISEALVATAVGLFLAITATFCYNHLVARLKTIDNFKSSALEHISNGIKQEASR